MYILYYIYNITKKDTGLSESAKPASQFLYNM